MNKEDVIIMEEITVTNIVSFSSSILIHKINRRNNSVSILLKIFLTSLYPFVPYITNYIIDPIHTLLINPRT